MKTSTIKTITIKNTGIALTVLFSSLFMNYSKAQSCVAAFTPVINGNNVTFTNNSTPGLYYNWNFGDGSNSSQNNPSHSYAASGMYVVCLTAYDSSSCYASACDTITVGGSSGACAANFSYNTAGNNATFSSTSTGGTVLSWWFSFGGSGGTTSTLANPTITFPSSGTYTACLNVKDSLGTWCDSICKQVTISGTSGACAANFIYNTTGNNATFTSTSTGSTVLSWWFSFGGSGGTTSTLANPTITFPSSGTYTACLNVKDSLGAWCDSTCKTVVIGTTGINNSNDVTTEINSYPNPFNGITTISYTLTKTSSVSISVYDLIGNEVAVLKTIQSESSGKQSLQWNASGLSNGLYLLTVRINENIYTQKLILGNY